jgi:hypothetical protein
MMVPGIVVTGPPFAATTKTPPPDDLMKASFDQG